VIGDAGEDVAEIGFGIDAVQPTGRDQRVHGGGPDAAGIRSGNR
jgi:hypothetical protein